MEWMEPGASFGHIVYKWLRKIKNNFADLNVYVIAYIHLISDVSLANLC